MCTVKFSDGWTTTRYQHREIMAESLGRTLRTDEHVHHKNENRSDNRLTRGHEFGGCQSTCCNLELLSASEHSKRHAAENPAPMVSLVCLVCARPFKRPDRVERHNRENGKVGPFCGKRCVGVYTSRLHPGVPQAARRRRDVSHGSYTMYKRGCHCDACRAANAKAAADRRARSGKRAAPFR